MSDERELRGDAMEGDGAYNRHAKLQADGIKTALPQLEKALGDVELDPADQPIIIADYGSSQGKNSLVPMRVAVRALRKRVGPERPICVFHVDQPTNDFNSLFDVIDADPDTYVANEPNVYPAAIGKSFYERVLPLSSVHVGWSSYAAVWLSRVPKLVPDHFMGIRTNGSVRAEFERQAARDWQTFLSRRSEELRPGGRLVVVLPALSDDGLVGLEPLFDGANEVLKEMVADGVITPEERSRMVLKGHPRRKRDLYAPFGDERQLQQLTVEDFAVVPVPDSAWTQYERDGDKESFSRTHALFFRSAFAPSLASALTKSEENGTRIAFADRLEAGIKRRLAIEPVPMRTSVQVMLLAKVTDARNDGVTS